MGKKQKNVFYDYQLARDIDKFGLEAFPNEGHTSEKNVIKEIKECFAEFDYDDETFEVVIYKVEIIKTIDVSIKNKKIIIVNE